MRQEFDQEFDALLRRTAARRAAPGGADEFAPAAAHLDADELSAFAEGALPAAARTAAVAHLADCAACRRAAASLASAAGVSLKPETSQAAAAPASESARAAESARWRAWWAALFAPRFLRYAAPALALCVVGVVSFVALRSSNREEMSARSAAETSALVGSNMNSNMSAANTNPAVAEVGETAAADANANLSTSDDGPAAASKADRPATTDKFAEATPNDGGIVRTDAGQTAGERPHPSVSESLSVLRPATPPPGASEAPSPAPADERRAEPKREEDEVVAVRDNSPAAANSEQERAGSSVSQARGAENQTQMTPDGSRTQQRSARNVGGGNNAPPPPRAPAKAKASPPADLPTQGRGVADARTTDADSAATRAVEGRRFRRQNGVWVDSNYRDSLPSVGVRRGTAAYRALVAELPEIGRAAERLAGEIVVVARGRAYRIRQ